MKFMHGFCVAMTMAGVVLTSFAVERNDLSPAAQALLPPSNLIVVRLKDGRTIRGEQSTAPAGKVMVKVTEGKISSKKMFEMAEVAAVEQLNIGEALARALKKYELDPKNTLATEEYKTALGLFDEYLKHWPKETDAGWITTQREKFATEYEQIKAGMEKIDGVWYPPVQGSVLKFRILTKRLTDLLKQYPTVAVASHTSSPKIKAAYEKIIFDRRAVARNLPALMQARLPILLGQKKFEEAAAEMDAFLRFWIQRVLKGEESALDKAQFGDTPFDAMDFTLVVQMEKQIMDAYLAANPIPSLIAATTAINCPSNMVYVPGGLFLMGREDAKPGDNDFPMRLVFIKPYLMDKYEVSNAEYRKFYDYVKQGTDVSMEHPGAPPLKNHQPLGWNNFAFSRDQQPVIGVDWFDAYAYAKWSGKRLPSEAEWEFAARGVDGRQFPWGSSQSVDRAFINWPNGRNAVAAEWNRQHPPPKPKPQGGFSCFRNTPPPPPPLRTVPVETWDVDQILPKQALDDGMEWSEMLTSPWGILHMAGNAAEWVNDWYDPSGYLGLNYKDPQGPATGTAHVFRGGHYASAEQELKTTYRQWARSANMIKGNLDDGRPVTGFRCVKDIEPRAK